MIQFDNILRMEVADYGVQVLTVNPGPVATSLFDKADPDGAYLSKLPRWMIVQPAELGQAFGLMLAMRP